MPNATIARHEQLSSDIEILLGRIKGIHDEEVLHRNDLRNNITDQKRFTKELQRLQCRRHTLTTQYEYLLGAVEEKKEYGAISEGYPAAVPPQEPQRSATPSESGTEEERLRRTSNELVKANSLIKDLEVALRQLSIRISDGTQSRGDGAS